MDISKTKTAAPAPAAAQASSWRRPRYDVSENEAGFRVRVSLPGVNRDGVDISYVEDTLRNNESDQLVLLLAPLAPRVGRRRLSAALASKCGGRRLKLRPVLRMVSST